MSGLMDRIFGASQALGPTSSQSQTSTPQQTQGTQQNAPQSQGGTTQPGQLPGGGTSTLEQNNSSQFPQQQNQQGQQGQQIQGGQQGQGMQGGDSGNTSESTPPTPFIDGLKDLWSNPPIDQSGALPAINADITKISEVAKGINFSQALSPQLVQKALAGDSQAFLQAINQVAQQVFTVATQASSHLVDQQSARVVDHVQKGLPNQIKTFQARDAFLTKNANFAHPAVQPLLAVVQQQLAGRFPNATTADLTKHAEQYLKEAFGQIVQSPPHGQGGGEDGEGSRQGTGAINYQQRLQANNKFDWDNWATDQNQNDGGDQQQQRQQGSSFSF